MKEEKQERRSGTGFNLKLPEVGESYYTINSENKITEDVIYSSDIVALKDVAKHRLNHNNIFKNSGDAKKEILRNTIQENIRRMAVDTNPDHDWRAMTHENRSCTNNNGWIIIYNLAFKRIEVYCAITFAYGMPVFKIHDKAKACVDILNKLYTDAELRIGFGVQTI